MADAGRRIGELLGADEDLISVSAVTISDHGELMVTTIEHGRGPRRLIITDPGRAVREAEDLRREATVLLSGGWH